MTRLAASAPAIAGCVATPTCFSSAKTGGAEDGGAAERDCLLGIEPIRCAPLPVVSSEDLYAYQ
jgi:hypothetical protein